MTTTRLRSPVIEARRDVVVQVATTLERVDGRWEGGWDVGWSSIGGSSSSDGVGCLVLQ